MSCSRQRLFQRIFISHNAFRKFLGMCGVSVCLYAKEKQFQNTVCECYFQIYISKTWFFKRLMLCCAHHVFIIAEPAYAQHTIQSEKPTKYSVDEQIGCRSVALHVCRTKQKHTYIQRYRFTSWFNKVIHRNSVLYMMV